MANVIEFKYLNSDTSSPVCGLTVNYSVKVIAVLTNLRSDEVISEGRPRGSVYTSDVIINGDETTNSQGIVEVDVTNVFSDNTFLELWQKFSNAKNYNVSIEISLETEKQEIGPYLYISQTNIPKELSAYNVTFDKENDEYLYPDLSYWNEWGTFDVTEVVINKELLEAIQAKKLAAQRDYTNSLQDFQNEIASQSTLQIPVLNEFNPINITQIITRCLELSVGTIENGLTYTTDAGLIAETNRLNKIKTLVSQISNLYPTITIEDGEGIPYQNIGVIPEPFRGFGFYQENSFLSSEKIIYVTSYLMGYDSGEMIEESCVDGIKIPEYPILITLNGEYVYGDTKFQRAFNLNVTDELNKQGYTLVDGDILNMSVFYNCTYYNSKLIIKK